jgi:hypothetical protein
MGYTTNPSLQGLPPAIASVLGNMQKNGTQVIGVGPGMGPVIGIGPGGVTIDGEPEAKNDEPVEAQPWTFAMADKVTEYMMDLMPKLNFPFPCITFQDGKNFVSSCSDGLRTVAFRTRGVQCELLVCGMLTMDGGSMYYVVDKWTSDSIQWMDMFYSLKDKYLAANHLMELPECDCRPTYFNDEGAKVTND